MYERSELEKVNRIDNLCNLYYTCKDIGFALLTHKRAQLHSDIADHGGETRGFTRPRVRWVSQLRV